MSVVALIGPDGAGKTTVARYLEQQLPFRVKYLYMGGQLSHGNSTLPTTKLWIILRRWHDLKKQKRGGAFNRWLTYLLNMLVLVTVIADEWLRQILILGYRLRGFVVVLDRHYLLDHHVYVVARTKGALPLGTRIHAFMLEHLYPRPDLVVYLDAAPEVMFARKGEESVEALYKMRKEYLEMSDRVRCFIILNANQPIDTVVHEAVKYITDFFSGSYATSGEFIRYIDGQEMPNTKEGT